MSAAKQQQSLTMGGNGGGSMGHYGAASASAYSGNANKAGGDLASHKMINDTIGRSMQNIKFVLHSLSEACVKATSNSGSRQSRIMS